MRLAGHGNRAAARRDEERWLKLTWRWAFLVALAILKDVVGAPSQPTSGSSSYPANGAMGADQRVSV